MGHSFKYYTYAMHFNEELFKAVEDGSLDVNERSRAVEFLALLPLEKAKKHVCSSLKDPHPMIREAAAIAAISHVDLDIYDSLQSRCDDPDELPSVKSTVQDTLHCWRDSNPETLERFQKIRQRILVGTNKVELIEHCGDDLGHALSAWTSTSRELTDEKRARVPALLQRLAKDGHHTPFEKSYIRFIVTIDMATHIHLLKHRIGVSINGESARYKELKDDKFYVPFDLPDEEELHAYIEHMEASLRKYHEALARFGEKGISRKRAKDLARFYIPYGNQIDMDVSFNFRSFMHFQGLRNSDHAQREVCNLSKNMLRLVWETSNFNESCIAFGWTKERIYEG